MKLFGRLKKRAAMPSYVYDGISLQNGRPTNMDCLGFSEREICGKRMLLAVVCDGVGSLEQGGFAAAEATRGMIQWFSELQNAERLQIRMREKLLQLNRKIMDDARTIGAETATTVSALLLTGQKYYIAHAGDSRVYLYRNRSLKQITQDDVSETGALTSCIGYEDDPLIYCGQGDLGDDTFLLCSDGMYKRMDCDYLLSQMDICSSQDIRATLEKLAGYAVRMGERDNITIAIIKNTNGGERK